jgi:hypothetical protein
MSEIKCCVCGATPNESESIYEYVGNDGETLYWQHRHPYQCIEYLKSRLSTLEEENGWINRDLYDPGREFLGEQMEFRDKNGNVYTGYWNCGFISCDEAGHPNEQISDVTHWRPLPSPKVGE